MSIKNGFYHLMMKLRDYSLLVILLSLTLLTFGQKKVSGVINDDKGKALNNVEIFDKSSGRLAITNFDGYYEFNTEKSELSLVFFSYEFQILELKATIQGDTVLVQTLLPLNEQLTAVEITARKAKVFELGRLKDVEETAIYAGKKTEVIFSLLLFFLTMYENFLFSIEAAISKLDIWLFLNFIFPVKFSKKLILSI